MVHVALTTVVAYLADQQVNHLLLLFRGQRRPDSVELGQGVVQVVGVDLVPVEVAALGREFRQPALRGLDLPL